MWFHSWLRNWKPIAPAVRRRTQASARPPVSFRPRLEGFEDRALPSGTLSINDVTQVAALGGQTAFTFTVSLSQPSRQQVNVKYATANGTATGGDYVPTAGTLHFATGQTTQSITVLVNAPTAPEQTETFNVKLSNAKNAQIYDGWGVGTIVPPYLSANDDSYWTYADQPVGGYAAYNVLLNDTDPYGSGMRVSAVNGSAANVGSTIQLASGAWLTVNPDGSFVYDPHGAFNYVVGAQPATDAFTYTVTDSQGAQSTATVTIYIYDPNFIP